jgi:geranylgeranyl diphosphate synthase type II
LYNFHTQYEKYLSEFEEYLQKYCASFTTRPNVLADSMKYSLQSGGKRIRPVLALATADVLGVKKEDVLPYALAVEMIHTYSLIHDDLPAMDNDDFRRGQPSNHKVYGEGNAILAGDGLLNTAFGICLQESLKGEKYARAALFLNECAGVYGMIAGQSADLYFSGKDGELSEDELLYIYACKTGKLILAPIAIASILANNAYYSALENFGKNLGFLFQLTDDILDEVGEFETLGKTVGKDQKDGKLTCVRFYGLENAKARADLCADDCLAMLEGVGGDVAFLSDLVGYVLHRNH